ncbi:uncharacterized protein LOC103707059 isoform X3 [Phoenix dactylifera]|uniref:Uncharacterized protein LOC103707059 isoform X3 n=1 Tax=Phoenix dactylifera TaxID=42345 RepID=A0A8B8J4M4_PHODC|nr:uncharacterized protein LOC103707059 isoform X3 [Phoenix dactylifera]
MPSDADDRRGPNPAIFTRFPFRTDRILPCPSSDPLRCVARKNCACSMSPLSLSLSCLAMARILSQTLIRQSQTLIHDPAGARLLVPPAVHLEGRRGRASRPEKAQLVEVDLETEAAGPDAELLGMRRLEDAIHGIVVRRSAPDWLPFIPGSSYWVPPRKRPYGVVELIGRLANPMTEEETLSLASVRGWPSSTYFVEGEVPTSQIPLLYGLVLDSLLYGL